jgi:hypothetical protein
MKMKTTKNFLSAAIIAALLIMLWGCSEGGDTTSESAENSEHLQTENQPEPEFMGAVGSVISLGFDRNAPQPDFRAATAELIGSLRNADRNDSFRRHLSEITEFYHPRVEIDGFELFGVTILGSVFDYHYAPPGLTDDSIVVSIVRSDAVFGNVPASPTIEDLAEAFSGEIRSGLVYRDDGDSFAVVDLLGDTWFFIQVFDKSNDFEFIRDIAARLVNTAELVDVEQELEVLRQSER